MRSLLCCLALCALVLAPRQLAAAPPTTDLCSLVCSPFCQDDFLLRCVVAKNALCACCYSCGSSIE